MNNIIIKTKRNEDTIYIFNNEFKDIEKVKRVCFSSGMDINDYEYIMLNQALEYINEENLQLSDLSLNNYAINLNFKFDFIDSHTEIYNHKLLKWVSIVGTEFTDMVLDEDSEIKSTSELLMRGYGLHLEKMFFMALDIIKELNNK